MAGNVRDGTDQDGAASPVIRVEESALRIWLSLAGLTGALALRLLVAGASGPASVPAGITFAAVLLGVAWAAGWRPASPSPLPILIGLVGGCALIAFPLWLRPTYLPPLDVPLSGLPLWMGVVTAVALAEEILLRGILFRLLQGMWGVYPAVAITAVAFALLHVPLYGPAALPLDLAVGVWLGGLRAVSGSTVAPAVAHTVADLAVPWLL